MAPLIISGAISLAKMFLPSLVGQIAGDTSGKVAEKVLDMAAEVTGVNTIAEGKDIDLAIDLLQNNPEMAVKLQTRLAELELETTKAFLGDIQDARSRDLELKKAGKDNVRADVMVVAAFVAIIVISVFLITADKIDAGVLAFLTTIGGMLMKNLSTAFDFEFGSSRGSKNKTSDMGSLMKLLGKK